MSSLPYRALLTSYQIRAAEDILSITRTLKELWLIGPLDTIGENAADVQRREKLEEDVRAIQVAIEGGVLIPPSLRARAGLSSSANPPSDEAAA